MSIESMVTYRCAAKEQIGDEQLLRLIKAKNKAEAVEQFLSHSDNPDRASFEHRIIQPEGIATQEVSLVALKAEAGKLVAYREACLKCPAGEKLRPFGCYAAVSYPITIDAEDRLMKLLPDDISKSPMSEFIKHWKSLGITGATSNKMRQNEGPYFEGKQTIIRSWGSEFQINSDQLIGSMFHLGDLTPSHTINLLYLLGIIDHSSSKEHLQGIFADLDYRKEILLGESIENSVRIKAVPEFASFLNAMRRAAALDVKLLIDF